MDSLANLSKFLPTRRYALPDKAVASQVLMYRQLLHTECKPGLRLSRNYEGTDAQKKVMHMPWWEQGVESSGKMVISYDNLIVRLWLNGAIMPYTDGGYAEKHSEATVPKDDCLTNVVQEKSGNDGHIDTLIDPKGLPPIPHAYWVDRLGFQQTDPVTDFRSGGVLSLAMLVHVVEVCPNLHARFLPSGDTHMLPFGITCINVTDMIAKFCMFSKSVDRMDALLSQKPFWKMFENPDSLLVLQELAMEILCNVVVEMGRERRLPKVDSTKDGAEPLSQKDQEVTVFDFAEILARTEKRVNDDLLGAGPRTVDELRGIHTRLMTKYMRGIERKEKQAEKMVLRAQVKGPGNANDKLAFWENELASATQATKNMAEPVKAMTGNVIGTAGKVVGSAGSAAGNIIGKTMQSNVVSNAGNVAGSVINNAGNVAGNVIEKTGGVFNKFKEFGLRPNSAKKSSDDEGKADVEEVSFAKTPDAENDAEEVTSVKVIAEKGDKGVTETDNPMEEAKDLLAFLDDDVGSSTEKAKKEFADLLEDSSTKKDTSDYFTIDDEDFLL